MANIDYKQEAKDALFAYIVDLDRKVNHCSEKIHEFPNDAPNLAQTNRYPLTMDENGEILKDCAYWYTLRASMERNLNNAATAYHDVFNPDLSRDGIIRAADKAIEAEAKGVNADDG